MTELHEKFLSPFTPGKMRYAQEGIEAQKAVFLDLLQLQSAVLTPLAGLGVSIQVAAGSDDFLLMKTPLGEIKSRFVSQLEGDYLGVAAVFSYVSEKSQDSNFFFVRMNSRAPWVDSTGEQLEVSFRTENTTAAAVVAMLQRVLAIRLENLESSLFSA